MNLEMLLSREPNDREVITAEIGKFSDRMTALMPTLADRREELLKEQMRLTDEKSYDYFLTSDWEIDFGVFLDTGKTPSHYSDLEFYARLLLYFKIMQEIMLRRYQNVEDRLVAAADVQFFYLKDLAEQGDEKAREMYEELKKLRPGGDKPRL